jgi:glucan phosphoethanolaminetransferase (alkaline phosphatase superfamily)
VKINPVHRAECGDAVNHVIFILNFFFLMLCHCCYFVWSGKVFLAVDVLAQAYASIFVKLKQKHEDYY